MRFRVVSFDTETPVRRRALAGDEIGGAEQERADADRAEAARLRYRAVEPIEDRELATTVANIIVANIAPNASEARPMS
jgi:hypothetical protein